MNGVHLIGHFYPDESDAILNDARCAAVLVHRRMGFNDANVAGVVEIAGCLDEEQDAAAVEDEMEDPPQFMTPKAARQLAALLIRAAKKAEAIAKREAGR